MPLYQLTLFYPNLKAHASTVQKIRGEIEAIAGNNWRVLSAGEQVCGIAFESDLEHKQLQARLTGFGGEHFLLLLTEVSAVVGGYLSPHIWQWLASRLPRKR